jgi:hypothetical protein
VRAAMAIFGTLLAAVIVLTFMTGGKFGLGTSPAGPSFQIGFAGPQSR